MIVSGTFGYLLYCSLTKFLDLSVIDPVFACSIWEFLINLGKVTALSSGHNRADDILFSFFLFFIFQRK